ncbi:MAG: hypothetical protein U0941_09900 [Planctomycetaceae bacterium]
MAVGRTWCLECSGSVDSPSHEGKGQKWFRLYDEVFAERNLIAAFQQVFSKHGAAGVDHVTVEEFARRSPEESLGTAG